MQKHGGTERKRREQGEHSVQGNVRKQEECIEQEELSAHEEHRIQKES